MCMSPAADFVAAGALAPIGVASLRTISRRDQLILGSLPMLFALHQFVEGFVWLGLQGHISAGLQDVAIRIYLLFAQVLLPVLVPLGLLVLEPDRARRRWMLLLLVLGVAVGVRLLWILSTHPVGAQPLDHVITYTTDVHLGYVEAVAYVAATCGPALLSTRRHLRWFGVANLAGLAAAASVRYGAVTSVWCLYAALVSSLILLHLRRPLGYQTITRAQRPARPRPLG
jgi:hypothetical protein